MFLTTGFRPRVMDRNRSSKAAREVSAGEGRCRRVGRRPIRYVQISTTTRENSATASMPEVERRKLGVS